MTGVQTFALPICDTFDDTKAFTLAMAKKRKLTLVHPYDDEFVMAGQGTIALEMLEAHPEIETLIVPIGGGGLIAGMATAAKGINPKIDRSIELNDFINRFLRQDVSDRTSMQDTVSLMRAIVRGH